MRNHRKRAANLGFINIMGGKIRVESPRKSLMQKYDNASPYPPTGFAAGTQNLAVDADLANLRENPV